MMRQCRRGAFSVRSGYRNDPRWRQLEKYLDLRSYHAARVFGDFDVFAFRRDGGIDDNNISRLEIGVDVTAQMIFDIQTAELFQ